jgi:hypothetical protein
MFFNDRAPEDDDLLRGCAPEDTIEVEADFDGLDGESSKKLQDMRFLSKDG